MGIRGNVVWCVAVEDEGKDEGGGAVADDNRVDLRWHRLHGHFVGIDGALDLMKNAIGLTLQG